MKIKNLTVIYAMLLMATATQALEQGKAEASFKINNLGSMELDGENGSGANFSDDFGWGFDIGYNYNEHLKFSYEFSYNQPGYNATVVTDELIPQEFTIRDKFDILNSQFNTTYYFGSNDFTPFISGGFGWAYMDSNIPTGDYDGLCIWDPWYGYSCISIQDTYDAYNFSYNGKVGLRWDGGNGMFIEGSYNLNWYTFDHADTLNTETVQVGIGWTF